MVTVEVQSLWCCGGRVVPLVFVEVSHCGVVEREPLWCLVEVSHCGVVEVSRCGVVEKSRCGVCGECSRL